MTLSVQTQQLCPEFTVWGQITVDAVAVLARQGHRSILNTRTGGEGGPSNPRRAQIGTAAEAAGFAHVHLHVATLMVPPPPTGCPRRGAARRCRWVCGRWCGGGGVRRRAHATTWPG